MATLIQPDQTLFFLGDHTSPDELGYVAIVKDVLARFHARLNTRLISAGSRKQTAGALVSQPMVDIITSSKPDWLIIGIGLADALREPAVITALRNPTSATALREQEEVEATFGPEFRVGRGSRGPVSDVGHILEPQLVNIAAFERDLGQALAKFAAAQIKIALLTTVLVGKDPNDIVNKALKAYNKSMRAASQSTGSMLIDIEKAFKDVLDRAATYKQSIQLATTTGELNAQGQALVARSLLEALGVLPQPGWRPLR